MQDKENTQDKAKPIKKDKPTVPDEQAIIHVSEHIKIFDPETGEVFLNKRES